LFAAPTTRSRHGRTAGVNLHGDRQYCASGSSSLGAARHGGGRTTVLITHRLTDLDTLDEILELHAGRVVRRLGDLSR